MACPMPQSYRGGAKLSADSIATSPSSSTSGFGLHCLRSSSSDTTVIFVHGILSDGESAWGKPSWPTLLLEEQEFFSTGLYVFTYKTGIMSRTFSVSDATDALREYFSESDIWRQKRIVFVCHSMGGIVVRRFIVANQARLARLANLIGIFLVASPSLGSKDANLLSILSHAFQHSQAAILQFSQSNTTLDDLNRDFRTLLTGKAVPIIGRELIEDRPIKIKRWLGLWRQVVEPFSAAAYFHGEDFEPLRIPDSDHSSIAKPQNKSALQHRALVRFLRHVNSWDNAKSELASATSSYVESASSHEVYKEEQERPIPTRKLPSDQAVLRAACSFRVSKAELVEYSSDTEAQGKLLVNLRCGRMMERMIASNFFRKHKKKSDLFIKAAEASNSIREFELIAPLLRFTKDPILAENAAGIFESKFKSGYVDNKRMRATLLGWSGERLLPLVDWSDNYEKEKFSYTYAKAYASVAWSEQSEDAIRSISMYLIEMNRNFKEYYNYEISIFDWLRFMSGVPSENAKPLLRELVKRDAPSDLIIAVVARMSRDPVRDSVEDLVKLVERENGLLSQQAEEALAFIPTPSERIRNLKCSLLAKGSTGQVISAGVEFNVDALDDVREAVFNGQEGEQTFFAAWALGQLASKSNEAYYLLGQCAREHSSAIVRAMCLIGLAAKGDLDTPALIDAELPGSRDIQRFCLLVAQSYTKDVIPLVEFLKTTPESRVYVPSMLTCFQRSFRDALRFSAAGAPILNEISVLSDDL